ncbi:MFS transporter [Nonomuraea sp. NN258]|uniref:MFS transporter n=1 Tax=Nonomuraea antri TaxID=2730852 RepID=UPI00156A600F|nr:MFS transporter [Nonomuraea antri]NRQ32604.1 MFS transporter [Nonomuraea antri]
MTEAGDRPDVPGKRGLVRDLGMLRDRRFALLLSARTISVLGTAFAPVALAFGVLDLPGATATTLSLVLAAASLPLVAFMLVGGVIADRLPRNRVMTAGEALNAVAYFALAAMLLTGWTPLPALMTASALSGIAGAVLFPALAGIVPDVVPAERLQTANALLGLGTNISRVAGLVLSGAAVMLLGGGVALAVSGAMFTLAGCLVLLLRLSPAAGRPAGARHSVLADLRSGWREFASRQWLWVVVVQFSVIGMAFEAAHGVLGPLVAKQSLGGAAAWAAVLAGEAVGLIGGVVVTLRIRPRRPVLVATLLTVPTALPYLLLGFAAPLWTVVLGAAVGGVCFDVIGVLWATTMQREIPAESLSRVSSYDSLGSLVLGPVGLLLAGPIAVLAGPRPALVGAGVVFVVVSLAALLAPGVRNLRAPEEDGRAEPGAAPSPEPSPSA